MSSDFAIRIGYDAGMRFSLRSLMLAVPLFGMASLALAQIFHFREAARIARANGSSVCGNSEMYWINAFCLAMLDGVIAISGRHRAAAIIGGVTAALIMMILGDR